MGCPCVNRPVDARRYPSDRECRGTCQGFYGAMGRPRGRWWPVCLRAREAWHPEMSFSGSFLSPFQGFRFYGDAIQGFTPLAIICRPVGAWDVDLVGCRFCASGRIEMEAHTPKRTWDVAPGQDFFGAMVLVWELIRFAGFISIAVEADRRAYGADPLAIQVAGMVAEQDHSFPGARFRFPLENGPASIIRKHR